MHIVSRVLILSQIVMLFDQSGFCSRTLSNMLKPRQPMACVPAFFCGSVVISCGTLTGASFSMRFSALPVCAGKIGMLRPLARQIV